MLEKNGFVVVDMQEWLGLSDKEMAYIDNSIKIEKARRRKKEYFHERSANRRWRRR